MERIVAHPVCRPARVDRRRAVAVLACALIAAACSREPQPGERRVEIVPTRTAAARRPPAAATAVPIARPSPPARPSAPRRAFVDPPLPAELVDPPGLVPLPPRPTFANDQQGETP